MCTARRRAGRAGSVVLIDAEAGMGKSRLLNEFQHHVADGIARVLMATGDRIERHVPYHGWRGIYAQLLGIDELDDVELSREIVLQVLGAEQLIRARC